MDKFHKCGGDGHYHKSATHDPRIGDVKYSTQHFYCINYRSWAMSHIQVTDAGNNKKKEHDLKALKRSEKNVLRQLAIKR